MNAPAPRLRLPGPTAVPARVRRAMAAPTISHRGPEFEALLRACESGLRPLLGSANDPLFFASSGTGMMEAAVLQVAGPGERLLILDNGQFAERFAAIAAAHGLAHDLLPTPWGGAPDPALLRARLRDGDYAAVLAVHNESATGAVADLAALGAEIADHRALFVVDSVSGVGGLELRQADWGVDVLIGASQKALMCPPGLAFVALSDKAWRALEQGPARPAFFAGFLKARESAAKGQTPFTPALPQLAALREALAMIHEEGIAPVLARHRRLSAALRAGGAALGLASFPSSPLVSDTVAVFALPADMDGGVLVRAFRDRFGTVIAGARNRLAGRVIRFGTMGAVQADDIRRDLEELGAVLADLYGHAAPEAGLAAAERVLSA